MRVSWTFSSLLLYILLFHRFLRFHFSHFWYFFSIKIHIKCSVICRLSDDSYWAMRSNINYRYHSFWEAAAVVCSSSPCLTVVSRLTIGREVVSLSSPLMRELMEVTNNRSTIWYFVVDKWNSSTLVAVNI